MHFDNMACRERGVHSRRVGRLDADDFGLRAEGFDDDADAGNQPPTADGDDDGIDVWNIFEDFEADGAGAGYDGGIVEAGDKEQAALFRDALRALVSIGEVFGFEQDGRPEAAAVGDLHKRGPAGHHNSYWDPQLLPVIGDS